MAVVTVKKLEKKFRDKHVIKGIDFELGQGKCIALLGPNGAGKTTSLRMLSGLIKPTAGSITFEGLKQGEDIRKLIGYLPQHPVFYNWMTGLEFLVYVGKLASLSKQEANKRAEELLLLVGIADAKKRTIGQYSGGMKQRLGIAQAIIHKPKLLILDEPVSALDPFGRREVLQLIEKLKNETTILFSTHILNDAEEVCDEILFLHNGQIVESGTMEELRLRYQQAKIDLVFQGDANLFIKDFSQPEMIVSSQYTGNHVRLIVTDLDRAKKAIMQESLSKNWPLQKFEISSLNLEDVFMKVVQK